MGKYKKPLSGSIFVSCLALVFILTAIISSIGYSWFKYGMISQYESYIGDVINLVKRHVDIEDIDNCLSSGVESEKFREFTRFLDEVRQSHSLDSLVISRPVKENDKYEIINIALGLYENERGGEAIRPEMPVPGLGDKIGYLFSQDVLPVIYENFVTNKTILYTRTPSAFGTSYVASCTINDKNDSPSVLVTTGLPMTLVTAVLSKYLVSEVFTAIILCAVVIVLMMMWLRKRIIQPLNSIEDAANAFEVLCRSETNPDNIVLKIPEIKTGDELEALSVTLSRMSGNVKKYVDDLVKSAVRMNNLEHNLDESQQKAQQLEKLATKDSLTGIRNKTAYDEEVKKVTWELEDGNKKFGVAMIDLNYLKRINDTFGHEKGNFAIINLCKLVCTTFAHSPVFRIGGDEFAVILKNTDYENVELLVEQFNGKLSTIWDAEELEPWEKTSAAIGYALFDENIDTCYDNVFRRADKAMYERKKEMKAVRE